jgi:hypothetical protein
VDHPTSKLLIRVKRLMQSGGGDHARIATIASQHTSVVVYSIVRDVQGMTAGLKRLCAYLVEWVDVADVVDAVLFMKRTRDWREWMFAF